MVKVSGIHMLYADALETTGGAEVGCVIWWGFNG